MAPDEPSLITIAFLFVDELPSTQQLNNLITRPIYVNIHLQITVMIIILITENFMEILLHHQIVQLH